MRLTATFLLVCGVLAANPEPVSPAAESSAGKTGATAAPKLAASGVPSVVVPSPDQAAREPTVNEPRTVAAEAQVKSEIAVPEKSTPLGSKPVSVETTAPIPGALAEGTTLLEHPEVHHRQTSRQASSAEIASLLRIGQAKQDKGDYATAEMSFLQVLSENATSEQDRTAVLGLARTFRKNSNFTKAGATYERFIKEYPTDPELPIIFLELGRTLRAIGAHQQAIARFYDVLNTTLKIPEQGPDHYRQLVRTAQYEIADTYFQIGDYVQANRYFSRLKLLDLAPEDRARAHFKSALALSLSGEEEKAVVSIRSFLDQNPEDENVPEAQYLLSVSLRKLNRIQESLHVTLHLLKEESSLNEKDAARWQYWQRKTGNQLANDFYERGEIDNALQIYTNLAQLTSETAWTLSATYQMGLCYERLRRFDRARECYTKIVDKTKSSKTEGTLRADLADLTEMAAWRLSQLDWQISTENQISAIFAPRPAHLPAALAPLSTVPLSAADHDIHGSAPIASDALR